ncbi:MAG: cysteine desulfurase [Acidobacteria bacterium]|nr:cysteine desulfurase [Acidobacteriota bacterium]
MLDPKIVRKDFPILDRHVRGGKPLVYLDSAATSQKPSRVIEAVADFYERHNANVHRGVYLLAEEATVLYEEARAKVAGFVGAPDPRALVFTKSCTEAINMVAGGWGRKVLRPGDEIVITEMEHHSNLIPWQMVARDTGAVLVRFPVTDDGFLDIPRAPITERTRLVCVAQMSNVLGTINPVRELSEAAHAAGALLLCDGAQGVPHLETDVAALGCDFFAFSGHKMLGPTGSGGLWARPELLEEMDPFLGGGEMIREVWFERATWNEIPYKFEGGTPAIASSIGLGAAVDYLRDLGMGSVRAHEVGLTRRALEALSAIEGLTIHGPADPERRGGVISFWLDDVHPHDLATILDADGLAIRAGHHCAQPLMRRLGVPATARASFYVYNTLEDVEALAVALQSARERFSSGAWL